MVIFKQIFFIKLYIYFIYKKSLKSINKLTKYINICKVLVALLSNFFNHQD